MHAFALLVCYYRCYYCYYHITVSDSLSFPFFARTNHRSADTLACLAVKKRVHIYPIQIIEVFLYMISHLLVSQLLRKRSMVLVFGLHFSHIWNATDTWPHTHTHEQSFATFHS